ncbi:MAG: hypothetical protein KBE65_10935 [Phycisphaerae bacterium]|nr:hypothetical protein [Phycisphaerae bacterium]
MTMSGDGESLCQRAREYYYELLRKNDDVVPEAIGRHVRTCPVCQEQLARLHEVLSETRQKSDSSDASASEEAIEALSRQFAFLGKPVRCSQVKPFLPDLLIPSRRIRVLTPIILHVGSCPQCIEDLASIRKLDLRADQLSRLARFYGRIPAQDPLCCEPAGSTTLAADLSHQTGRTGVPTCDEITSADLFDLAMPPVANAPATTGMDGRTDAVAVHARTCPRCLARVQQMRRTIQAIAERPDSTVCTVFRPEEDAQDLDGQTQGLAYPYPLDRSVVQPAPLSVAVGREPDGPDEPEPGALVGHKAGPRVKTALRTAVALVIVLVLLLLLHQPTATGTNAGQIRKAVSGMTNVYIARFAQNGSEPDDEMWVAGDRQVVAIRVGDQRTVYRLALRQKTVIDAGHAPRTVSLEPVEVANCTEYLNRTLREVLPGVLADAPLSGADPVASDRPGESWSVYELTRVGRSSTGAAVSRHWKIFMDPRRQLPVKIEYTQHRSPQSSQTCARTTRFEYPSPSEMDRALTALSTAQ